MILADIFCIKKMPCFCYRNFQLSCWSGNPCVYAASQLGCYNPNCGYCHACHTESKKTRPRKSMRTYWKQEIDKILAFQAVTSELLISLIGLIGKRREPTIKVSWLGLVGIFRCLWPRIPNCSMWLSRIWLQKIHTRVA